MGRAKPMTIELIESADDDAYCRSFVSACDRDRYLASLFAPADKRRHLNALHAFAADLAAIKSRASEPLVGQIRLQWWRDSLVEMVAGTIFNAPIADALIRAIAAADLPKSALEAMIDAREAELGGDHLVSLASFEHHLAATDGAIFAHGVQILTGQSAAEEAPHGALRAAGIALGLTRTMTRCPSPSSAMDMLPRDLLAMHGAQLNAASTTLTPALKAVQNDLIATARHHLIRARGGTASLAHEAHPALLPLATIEADLKRIERAPFAGPRGALRRQLSIYLAARRGQL